MQTKKIKLLNGQVHEEVFPSFPNTGTSAENLEDKVTIRRPPNAFIIFSKEWRKNIAAQNPQETNTQISTRLGAMWKLMSKEQKVHYTDMARNLNQEHRETYPDYVYSPKQARLKKALRAEARYLKISNMKSRKMNTAVNGTSSRHNPQEERGRQERTKDFQGQIPQNMLRGCIDRYLDVGNNPNQQCASYKKCPQNGNCVDISKIDGQRWLPCIQKSESGAIYITFTDDIKIHEGDLLANHITEHHQQQVQSGAVTKRQDNSSYGRRLQIRPSAETPDNNEPAATGHINTQNERNIGSSGDDATRNVQQDLHHHKQLALNALLFQNVISTEENTKEDREVKPMSLENSVSQLPQRLLEDNEVSVNEFLSQPDFDNEIIAYEAVLFLEKL
jgi:hypothetical protein